MNSHGGAQQQGGHLHRPPQLIHHRPTSSIPIRVLECSFGVKMFRGGSAVFFLKVSLWGNCFRAPSHIHSHALYTQFPWPGLHLCKIKLLIFYEDH